MHEDLGEARFPREAWQETSMRAMRGIPNY
jgi:hypothetical protein